MGLVPIGGSELLLVSLPAEVLWSASGHELGSAISPLCLCGSVPGVSPGRDKSCIGMLSSSLIDLSSVDPTQLLFKGATAILFSKVRGGGSSSLGGFAQACDSASWTIIGALCFRIGTTTPCSVSTGCGATLLILLCGENEPLRFFLWDGVDMSTRKIIGKTSTQRYSLVYANRQYYQY